MTVSQIIEALDKYGVGVELGLKFTSITKPSPEAETLMQTLANKRDETVDHLITEQFFDLPADVALPSEWTMSPAMKKFVLEAPTDIIAAFKNGHSLYFLLLIAFKALCFVRGGKELYMQLETILRERHGFDYDTYYTNWSRYIELRDNPPSLKEMTDTIIAEYANLIKGLKEMGAQA